MSAQRSARLHCSRRLIWESWQSFPTITVWRGCALHRTNGRRHAGAAAPAAGSGVLLALITSGTRLHRRKRAPFFGHVALHCIPSPTVHMLSQPGERYGHLQLSQSWNVECIVDPRFWVAARKPFRLCMCSAANPVKKAGCHRDRITTLRSFASVLQNRFLR